MKKKSPLPKGWVNHVPFGLFLSIFSYVLRPERPSMPCYLVKSERKWYRKVHMVNIEWQTKTSKVLATGFC